MQMSRLFEILYILLQKKMVTARELAERFEVSPRTIYRDIDTLNLSGVPVYTTKGKGGGIGLLPSFVLDKSILTEHEQNEILSALQGFSTVQSPHSVQVLRKLSTVFNKSTVPWVDVDLSDWTQAHDDRFHLLKTAIIERRVVTFDYYSTYGEKTHRRVEPVQLWFKHRAWYIKGFCLDKQRPRLFKITRVSCLALTQEAFAERTLPPSTPEDDPTDRYKTDVTLQMHIAPEMSYRVYDEFSEEQIIKHPDGSFTVRVTYPEDEWVYGFILSFGEFIRVVEPAHIRAIIQEKLQKILGYYK